MKFFGETSEADWRRPSVIALILANLIPVIGVLKFGWEVFPLILLFWVENVIVGVLNVLKMLMASPESAGSWLGKLFMVPFFCVHYGIFTLVHGVFVFVLFGGGLRGGMEFPGPGVVWETIQQTHLGWAVAGLGISHGISFAANYIGSGEFRRASVPALMQQPYGRVVVLHLTIMGGGFLLMALHSPLLGLLLLVALKIALDLRSHFAERRKMGVREAAPGLASLRI